MSSNVENGMRLVCKVPRPKFMRELEPGCPERPRKQSLLTVRQLTDLVNYVLKLPLRNWAGEVTRDCISVPVISSWHHQERGKVQTWCETQLILEGVLPKRSGRMRAQHPWMLDAWMKKPWEGIA